MSLPASELTPAELRAEVLERAHRMTRVPLLPSACQRLLEISRMSVEIVDITELSNIVSHDPSMASRILKVANSPYYSIKQAVSSVRQAILVIGLSDLMSLLLVTSLMEKFNQDEAMTNLSPMDFWIHSVAVGAATRCCAGTSSGYILSPSEISLAGLLHDIGKSVFIRFFPKESDRCIQTAMDEGCSLLEAEQKVFGITHEELGGGFLPAIGICRSSLCRSSISIIIPIKRTRLMRNWREWWDGATVLFYRKALEKAATTIRRALSPTMRIRLSSNGISVARRFLKQSIKTWL